jgi:hypothetical protein
MSNEVDVIQDEATQEPSKSGNPMLEARSPTAHRDIEAGAATWTRFRIRYLPGFPAPAL